MNETTFNKPVTPAHRRGLGLNADWRHALRAPLVLGLAALLLAQLALALLMGRGDALAPALDNAPLLSVDADAVTTLEISSGAGDSVLLRREGDGWVLPGLGDFPASSARVDQLLDELAGLIRPLPVATSAEAQRRFRVADDDFERRLSLRAGSDEVVLVIGDSPGFRRLFARLDGEDAVYDLRLALFDLAADADGWIDRGQLQFDRGEITRIAVEDPDGSWALVRGEEGWALEGTAAAIDQDIADALADAVATLGYSGVFGADAAADYDLDQPARILDITHNGQQRRYVLAAIADSEDYALQRDGEDPVYRVSAFDAGALLDTDPAALRGEDTAAVSESTDAADAADVAATEQGASTQVAAPSEGAPAADAGPAQPGAAVPAPAEDAPAAAGSVQPNPSQVAPGGADREQSEAPAAAR
jgi:hypothetical protein